jgi:hypothetical protein
MGATAKTATDEPALLVLPRGESTEIRLYRSTYNGKVSTRLHEWYKADDGEMRPGRRIISLRDEELRDVAGALAKVAEAL